MRAPVTSYQREGDRLRDTKAGIADLKSDARERRRDVASLKTVSTMLKLDGGFRAAHARNDTGKALIK
jgi:hypothetical protein